MAKKKISKTAKEAADRAERRSSGIEETEPRIAIDPPIHAGGRPTDYKPEFCNIAADAFARGATVAEVADILGVSRWSVWRWSAEHPEFCTAIKVGKEIADERVGFSLYERAVGYTYDSVKIMQNAGCPLIVPFKEHVPPDVGAQKHWLANRQPKQWGASSDGADQPNALREMTQLEIARRLAFMLGEALRTQAKIADAGSNPET